MPRFFRVGGTALVLALGCGGAEDHPQAKAFLGARVFDGVGPGLIEDAVLVVTEGRVTALGPATATQIPAGAERIDLANRIVIPGLINTHGHVGATVNDPPDPSIEERLVGELRVYARYGVTTVNSLGGDRPAAVSLRDAQAAPGLDRARIFVAGAVVTGPTPEAARQQVESNAELGVDFIKIRVDDNLGTSDKMTPATFAAVIERAHEHDLPVAAHVFYLDDAKALLTAGVDLIAHSVRDRIVDDEFVELLRTRDICYVPTLTREVSTFVYGSRPDFFEDPFFLREADPEEIRRLADPERQAEVRASPAAPRYREALRVAQTNIERVAAGGATVAFGTDTGPRGRFQGFFEHLETRLMAESGLSPEHILRSATGDAARCLGRADVGALTPGRWADFLVLRENPLDDIANLRTLDAVWIGGSRVPDRPAS